VATRPAGDTGDDDRVLVSPDDPGARRLTDALQTGYVAALTTLLADRPELARARFGDGTMSRTALHVATDWPGHLPRVAESIAALTAAGADPDARFVGGHVETPLHWAASSDDVEAVDALVTAGADIEADGAVLTGGTPLADAVVFAQWRAARRLLEHGSSTALWQAAALGLTDAVQTMLDGTPDLPADELDAALWHACRGGSRATADLLLTRGADPRRVLWDGKTAIDAAEEHALTAAR
jgi:ankyrin repeat protein